MFSFFLFSRDKPLASNLVLGLGLVLALGNGWGTKGRSPFGFRFSFSLRLNKKGIKHFHFHYFIYKMSSFNKFKTLLCCVCGRHYSGTNNIRGVVTSNNTKMLNDTCVNCKRNRSMTVSGAIINAEGLKDFITIKGKAKINFGKKVANNPVRALTIASKIGRGAASRNSRAALAATPDLIKFATTGKDIRVVEKDRGLYLGTKKR